MAAQQQMDLAGLRKYLESLGGRMKGISLRPTIRASALYLASRARACFDESRDPWGTPWLPLKSPSRKRGGASAKPLRDTGLLMASVMPGGQGNVTEVTETSLVYGSGLDRAAWHNGGTRTIPARKFLGVTPADEARVAAIIADYVQKQIGA